MVGINLAKALKAAQKFGVIEVASYVLERTGDVEGALSLRLQQLSNALDLLEGDFSTDVQDTVKSCFLEASSICFRNSSSSDPSTGLFSAFGDSPDEHWDRCLSALLCHQVWRTKAIQSQNIKKFSIFLVDLLVNSCVELGADAVLDKIVKNCADLPLSLIRPTISSLLDTISFNASMANAAVRAVSGDTFVLSHSLVRNAKQGTKSFGSGSVCFDCENPLTSDCMLFMCGHHFHHDCVESKSCPVCFPRKIRKV
ncbi:hypothetical protein GEMRC1_004905 [Eukaryota sp. GEM-RC1]